jgi:hypothetical protein
MSLAGSNPGFSVHWSMSLGRESSNPETNGASRSDDPDEEKERMFSARKALCNQFTA